MEKRSFYEFKNFRLDLAEGLLFRDGKQLSVTPKAFHLLKILVENHGHIVDKEKLISEIWAESFVEDGNLAYNATMLRKVLGDDAANPIFIETLPRRGYRFIADVRRVEMKSEGSGGDEETSRSQATRQNVPPINFPPRINQITTNVPGPVIALADWHRDSDEKEPKESDAERSVAKLELVATRKPVTNKRKFVFFAGLALSVLVAGFFVLKNEQSLLLKLGISSGSDRNRGFWRIEKLTDTGNINGANISPDGKLLAYITDEVGKHGIWLRQLTTGKTVPVIPVAEELLLAVRFSKDGDFIYYLHQPKGDSLQLSRVSTLGGSSTKLLSDLHGGYDFSPDETQIAFVRLNEHDTTLMIADASGGNERAVFSSPKPNNIIAVGWSPNGKTIAYSVGKFEGGGKNFGLMEFDIESRTEKPITDAKWTYMGYFSWLPDGSGLMLAGRPETEGSDQVWRISASDGKTQQVTNDSSALSLSGATANYKELIAMQDNLNSTLWVAPANDLANMRTVSKAQTDLAWSADGKLIFSDRETLDTDIWETNADGSGKKQLTANNAIEQRPKVSPDGKFIIFVSSQDGRKNIWRMDIDGANLKQLTTSDGEDYPTFAHDGQSVIFNSIGDGSVWTVPLSGGVPTQITQEKCVRLSISPSGDKVAYVGKNEGKRKLLVKTFPEFRLLHEFEVNSNNPTPPKIVWTDNEKTLVYAISDESLIGNLMRQEISGGPPQKQTNFTSSLIFDFDYSRDGTQLGIVSGSWNHDIVLIHEP